MANYISRFFDKVLAKGSKCGTSNDDFNKFTDIKEKPCLDQIFADGYCENVKRFYIIESRVQDLFTKLFLAQKGTSTYSPLNRSFWKN